MLNLQEHKKSFYSYPHPFFNGIFNPTFTNLKQSGKRPQLLTLSLNWGITWDFLRSSMHSFRKPENILATVLLWRLAVHMSNSQLGKRWWCSERSPAIVRSSWLRRSALRDCPSSIESTRRNRECLGGSNSSNGSSTAFLNPSWGSFSKASVSSTACTFGSDLTCKRMWC